MNYLLQIIFKNRVYGLTWYELERKVENELLYLEGITLESIFDVERKIIKSNLGLEVFANNQVVNNKTPITSNTLYTVKKNNELLYDCYISSIPDNCSYNTYRLVLGTTLTIGRADTSIIKLENSTLISRVHALIICKNGNWVIKDVSGKAGVYLNNKKIIQESLCKGDTIWILGNIIVFMGDFIIVQKNLSISLAAYKVPIINKLHNISSIDFQRAPRIIKSLETGDFDIDGPTQKNVLRQMPVLLTIGPSLTMSMTMMVSLAVSITSLSSGGSITSVITSGFMAISMLAGALLWPTLLRKYNEKQVKIQEALRQEKYSKYIEEKSNELNMLYEKNHHTWNEILSPAPNALIKFLVDYKSNTRLWERTKSDSDFLDLRLGIGEHDFEVDVKIAKTGFDLDDDELKKYPKAVANKYKVLKDVPVTLPLLNSPITGLFGELSRCKEIMKTIILETMILHSPSDVKVVFLMDHDSEKDFRFAMHSPSVWNDDHSIRFVASNKREAHKVLGYINEQISENRGNHTYILFVTNKSLIENELISRYIENEEISNRIKTIFINEKISGLPTNCNAIIRCFKNDYGVYYKNSKNNKYKKFVPDEVSSTIYDTFKREIVKIPVSKITNNLSVPSKVTFMDAFKCGNIDDLKIEQKWFNNNSNNSLAALIGLSNGNMPTYLDIHESYHGCHGLVAGMTGSGKTEFLQEFILSLMSSYSPKEVSFVLVDFKGGDMLRPFVKTSKNGLEYTFEPHVSATITNLSSNQLHRALVSLNAEIKYRQRRFNEEASKLEIDKIDINSYQKYVKQELITIPLPHLIVVIDEFAQLKTQYPDFLQELVNVAQVGRSLGIHLILATQKPSGVVDPQIWSNARFKVCLKVSQKEDSNEMIGRADAAFIKDPGRGYVQVGYDEMFCEVQTSYSGAEYIETANYIKNDDVTLDVVDMSNDKISSKKMPIEQRKTGKTQIEEIVTNLINIGKKHELSARRLWCDNLKDKYTLKDFNQSSNNLEIVIGMIDVISQQNQQPLFFDFSKLENMAILGMAGRGKTTLIQSMLYQLMKKNSPSELQVHLFDFAGPALKYFNDIEHVVSYCDLSDEQMLASKINNLEQEIQKRKRLFTKSGCSSFSQYKKMGNKDLSQQLVVIDYYAPLHERFYALEDKLLAIMASAKTCGISFIITGTTKGSIYYKVIENIEYSISFKQIDEMDYRDIFYTPTPITPEDVQGRAILLHNKEICEVQTLLIEDFELEADRINYIKEILPNKKMITESVNEIKEVEKPNTNQNVITQLADEISIEEVDFKNGMFIAGKKNKTDLILDYIISKTTKWKVYHITEKYFLSNNKKYDEDEITTIVNELSTSDFTKDVYIIIDDFIKFFNTISDDSLDLLEKIIQINHIKCIVCSDFKNLSSYNCVEIYNYMIKQENIIIAHNNLTFDQLGLLHNSVIMPKQIDENSWLVFYEKSWSIMKEIGDNYE